MDWNEISKMKLHSSLIRIFLSLIVIFHIGIVSSIFTNKTKSIVSPLYNDAQYRKGPGADFFAVYHAGMNIRNNVSPYEKNDDGVTPYYYPFRYLPILAYAAQFITYISPDNAYIAWMTLIELSLFAFLFAIRANCKNSNLLPFATVLLFMSSPFFLELYMGQFTFVSTILFLIALIYRDRWAGKCLLGASILIKPFTAIALPAFLKKKELKFLWTPLIITMLLVFVPFFIQPHLWSYFYNANISKSGSFSAGNFGFSQLIFMIMRDTTSTLDSSTWMKIIQIFRSLILISGLLITFFSRAKTSLLALFLLILHFFTYPDSWEHHLSGLGAIGIFLLITEENPAWFRNCLMVCLLFIALPTPFYLLNQQYGLIEPNPFLGWPKSAQYLLILPKCIPVCIFSIAMYIRILREGFNCKIKPEHIG